MTDKEDERKFDYEYHIDKWHFKRRREILAAHPELRSLMRLDPSFKYVAMATAITHVFIAYLFHDAYLSNTILFAFFVGGVFCSVIANAHHETVHDQAFGQEYPMVNKIYGLLINLSLSWPLIGGYHKTHRHHHAYLGTNLDAKYPPMDEAIKYDNSLIDRLKFVFLHPMLGGDRWAKHNANVPDTNYEKINFYSVWAFNAFVFLFFGWRSLVYLLVAFWANDSIWLQGSKNLLDHWVDQNEPHVLSYYGPFNAVNFNIGFHREHHDFPNIPGRFLKQVNIIAAEYYSDKRYYSTNLFGAMWEMLMAPPGKGLTKHANKLRVATVEKKEKPI